MSKLLPLLSLIALLPSVFAQQSVWGQCGGIGWTGATTCAAGTDCHYYNDYYSQCIPSTSSTTSTTVWTTTTSTTTSVSSTTSTTTSTAAGSTSTAGGLNKVAKAAGKLYFGSATDNPELTDAPYVAILSDTSEFGQITPGNTMKWYATEPTQNTFSFTSAQAIVDLAQGNGQIIRGHNCVWHSQLPSWVTAGNFSATDLTSIIQTHCGTIVSHWAGQIYGWDVVNEPLNDDGTYRTSVFYNTLGLDYITIALNAAKAADNTTKLYINEYNLEYGGSKYTTMLSLVESLLDAGVPLDGVGFQGHLIVGSVPNFQAQIKAFTDLGLEVAITELDIRLTLPVTDALLAQQKADYETVIKSCQAVSKCIGVTVWDYTDKYSWVPSTFSGQGAALPWDENLVKKPAYDGIVIGFQS